MFTQTVIWTALPKKIDGALAPGSVFHLSAYVSPRLFESPPTTNTYKLQDFPDWLDWPAQITAINFKIEFEGGPTLNATVENGALRSELWKKLFNANTLVIPYEFDDHTQTPKQSVPEGDLHDFIAGLYSNVASNPAYGAGATLPSGASLAQDPGIKGIAGQTGPAEPYVPPPSNIPPARLDGPPKPPQPHPRGCGCGCIGWLVMLIRRILHAIGLSVFMVMPDPFPAPKPKKNPAATPQPTDSIKDKFDQAVRFIAPFKDIGDTIKTVDLPVKDEIDALNDFHRAVSLLGNYPNVLRDLGLVVDLKVTLGSNLPPLDSTVRVIPEWTPQMTATTLYSPKTHYQIANSRFLAKPRVTQMPINPSDPRPEISNGLLRLNDDTLFRVIQEDVIGSAVKVQNAATNMVWLYDDNNPNKNGAPNMPTQEGLPALRTKGIAVIRPNRVAVIQQVMEIQKKANDALASLEAFTIADAQGQPPPAQTALPPAELFAEDLVRGYRVDVFDAQTKKWYSLCQRVGKYTFGVGVNAIELSNLEDESFVQPSATEPVPGTAAPLMRFPESIFTWDGWSLAAPRLGNTLRVDGTSGQMPNEAKTSFPLITNFNVKPKSLPRLRFGYKYNLRMRVADLAGNSVFSPGDPGFQQPVTEQSSEIKFTRFEPVSPPPVALRAKPIEGESVERMVVRSTEKPSFAQKATERHVVPPKISQITAELHTEFDTKPPANTTAGMLDDAAGYTLGSREAGSLIRQPNGAAIPGVHPVTVTDPNDPTKKIVQTFWQTNAQFELTYLPDPLARSVLLLRVISNDPRQTALIQQIKFDGDWPDRHPFRVRLVAIGESATPQPPTWVDADPNPENARVLTIQLKPAEMMTVQFNSMLDAQDLVRMGVWQWVNDAAPANLSGVLNHTTAGQNWLLMPYRELTLVHALQRPRKAGIVKITTIAKTLGDTSAALEGNINFDAPSTGKLDVVAEWNDPRDDPTDPNNDPSKDVVKSTAHVGEIHTADPAQSLVALNHSAEKDAAGNQKDIVQNFADTKYHSVLYTASATTRFREYMPLSVRDDSKQISAFPSAAEISATQRADIPNSARPLAPDIVYVVPSFRWGEAKAVQPSHTIITRTRYGNGLRVYLKRPWFSSGKGELLGVVVLEGTEMNDIPEKLWPYVTKWGADPIWKSNAPAPGLTFEKFAIQAAEKDARYQGNVWLDEFPSDKLSVAGFQVEYDKTRGLWFSDIEMNPLGKSFDPTDLRLESSYFPFIRLALARFQPKSVDGAHISRVVLADYAQLIPDRRASFTISASGTGAKVGLTVAGLSFGGSSSGVLNQLDVGVEELQDPARGELGWEELQSGTDYDIQTDSPQPNELWRGTIKLTMPFAPNKFRVFVKEWERHNADGKENSETRLVYADTCLIEN